MEYINRTNSLFYYQKPYLAYMALSTQEYLYLHGFSLADANYRKYL